MNLNSLNPDPIPFPRPPAFSAPASTATVELLMARSTYRESLATICRRAPESGGLLLGPIGSNDVTDFYFDATADCTGGTYSPDTATLTRKLKHEWIPAGLEFRGFLHSHPGRMDRPSSGDLRYVARLLQINPELSQFALPIVIPSEFRMRPFVVRREQPCMACEARLILF